MNNQKGFAPIIVVLIVIALVTGGILTWQYLRAPKEEISLKEKAKPELEKILPSAVPSWTSSGDDKADSRFGSALAAGDINSDGYEDIIVGAYGYKSNNGKA